MTDTGINQQGKCISEQHNGYSVCLKISLFANIVQVISVHMHIYNYVYILQICIIRLYMPAYINHVGRIARSTRNTFKGR